MTLGLPTFIGDDMNGLRATARNGPRPFHHLTFFHAS
jgi:hypothetical protein